MVLQKQTPKPTVSFSASTFFCLFHNFMLWLHSEALRGFKVLAFAWNSLDLGAKQHHMRANIWFDGFFKVSITSVCPRVAVLIFVCDFMILSLLRCVFTKADLAHCLGAKAAKSIPGLLHMACCYGARSQCRDEDTQPSVRRPFSAQKQSV